jgi:hypothetical protein
MENAPFMFEAGICARAHFYHSEFGKYAVWLKKGKYFNQVNFL